ncbi:MAG: ywqD 2 [Pedosphaera sp.]|nr:ywqD 2 [Pedosphaera sp.]
MKPDAQIKLKAAGNLLALGGLALLALGLSYQFFTPKLYRASAVIRVENRGVRRPDKADGRPANLSEALSMAAEYELLKSDAFQSQVISNLNLREIWGKRSPQGAMPGTNEVRMLLQSKTRIHPLPNAGLIEIQVTSEERDDTALIANEFARLYRNYRESQSQNVSRERIDALRKNWDAEDRKVREAQERLEKIVSDIKKARAADTNSFYDRSNIAELQNKRIELEASYVEQQNMLVQLKALKPEQLRQVLPIMVTNEMLNVTLDKLTAAKHDLSEAQTALDPETPEVKSAVMVVEERNKNVTEAIAGMMTAREAEVAALKTTLDDLTQKLASARTNTSDLSTNNPAYRAALQEVQSLEDERYQLKTTLATNSIEAVLPLSLSATIVENAQLPLRPALPDPSLAHGVIGSGALAGVIGLLLLFITRKSKPLLAKATVK